MCCQKVVSVREEYYLRTCGKTTGVAFTSPSFGHLQSTYPCHTRLTGCNTGNFSFILENSFSLWGLSGTGTGAQRGYGFSPLAILKIQPVLESPDHSGPDFSSELSYMSTGIVQPDLYCVSLTLKSVERNRSFHGTACFTNVSFRERLKSPKNVLF